MLDVEHSAADAVAVAPYTLRQLEYFVAVADAGTVTGAAAQVHLSQSAMSTALSDLERTLGVQLVVRQHARGVTLTPAGARLAAQARMLLGQADDLQALASHLGGDITGTLTVGCFAIIAPYALPGLLSAAAAELPGLQLRTAEEGLDQLAAGLVGGRFELAIGYDLADEPELDKQELCTVAPHVVLPTGHRLARRRRLTLAALSEEPLVLLDLPHSRDYFGRLFAASQVQPVIRHRTHSAELARALVARGGGYTLLNLRPRSSVSLEGLPYAVVPLDVPLPPDQSHLRVVLMQMAGGRPTRRAQAVAQLCRDVVPALIQQN